MHYPISWYMYNQAQKTTFQGHFHDSHPWQWKESHIHELAGGTSAEVGHMHEFVGTTEPALSGVAHTHEYLTTTHFIDGHRHVIRGRTGPAIPLQGGGHFHYI